MNCPNCDFSDCYRDEVDIGVGIQYGPWICPVCGWYEGHDLDSAIEALQVALDKPSKAALKLGATYDQIRSECRDSPAKREAVVQALVMDGCEHADAEEWADRREV